MTIVAVPIDAFGRVAARHASDVGAQLAALDGSSSSSRKRKARPSASTSLVARHGGQEPSDDGDAALASAAIEDGEIVPPDVTRGAGGDVDRAARRQRLMSSIDFGKLGRPTHLRLDHPSLAKIPKRPPTIVYITGSSSRSSTSSNTSQDNQSANGNASASACGRRRTNTTDVRRHRVAVRPRHVVPSASVRAPVPRPSIGRSGRPTSGHRDRSTRHRRTP